LVEIGSKKEMTAHPSHGRETQASDDISVISPSWSQFPIFPNPIQRMKGNKNKNETKGFHLLKN
jgi:hypothetical protein